MSLVVCFCSCIPLYNFNYVYTYVMASQKSFVDRFVICFISVLELLLTITDVRCLELSKASNLEMLIALTYLSGGKQFC